MNWMPRDAVNRSKHYNTELRKILMRDKYVWYTWVRCQKVAEAEILPGQFKDGEELRGYLYFTLIGDRCSYGFFENGEAIQAFLEQLKDLTQDTVDLKDVIRTLKAYE